ncbi:hypothetical protein GCM10007108_06580 [Thermogymnomonas acidicola]|uniref:Uncharacterized protein n=1 Tax=Thermogymnomonas acidicola TaxID=399579 RepID=A0AA37F9A4_9ARCH|nr:hypothetical protein GCM10007108_06580 [Thermogymnomonas acidicola]
MVLEGIMCVEKAWYVGNGDYGYAIWLKVRGITHDRIKTIGKGRTRKMMKIVIR